MPLGGVGHGTLKALLWYRGQRHPAPRSSSVHLQRNEAVRPVKMLHETIKALRILTQKAIQIDFTRNLCIA